MKKTNYMINTKMMSVVTLKQAAMLKTYGIDKPSDFEISQFSKLGLTNHLKGVITTAEGIVLCNWELVQIAKAAKVKEIEVTVIEGLSEDEIPQVIAVTNVRKRLSKKKLADLIIEYRDYLTINETGKAWADSVPGDSTDAKIGTLVGYSYGMINGYQKIYKFHPEFLGMIDKDELSYTEAMKLIKNENTPPATPENTPPTAPENTPPAVPCEKNGSDNPLVPTVAKVPKNNYAGEANMVPCEAVQSIQIRYASGKTIDVSIVGSEVLCQLFGSEIALSYSAKKEAFDGGGEFHRLDSSDNKCNIELVIRKAA